MNNLVDLFKNKDNTNRRSSGMTVPVKHNTHDVYQDIDAIVEDQKNDGERDSNQEINRAIAPSVGQNSRGSGRVMITDINKDRGDKSLEGNLQNFKPSGVALDIVSRAIAPTSGLTTMDFSAVMKQLGFFNPTTSIIKITYNRNCLTDDYDVICNANKTGIFPPTNFTFISILVETGSNGFIKPTLYAYAADDKNVGISGI